VLYRNRIFLLIAGLLFFSQVNLLYSTNRSLEDFFFPPEQSGRSVLVVCKMTVNDTSSDWGTLLFAGFVYASSVSDSVETIAVAIKEQDGVTRVYTVRRKDFIDFINDRIQLRDFLRKVTISRMR
jgi:hypothetical protein